MIGISLSQTAVVLTATVALRIRQIALMVFPMRCFAPLVSRFHRNGDMARELPGTSLLVSPARSMKRICSKSSFIRNRFVLRHLHQGANSAATTV
jgi:hypothetical protein